jgi:serine/threonine protein kinase
MAREEILTRGTRLDRYEIRELVGKGGMGQVYRAWDERLRRDVAIKLMRGVDEERMGRFSLEAEAVGALDNRNIVTVLDCGVDGGRPYIVMEFLRGESLAERLKRGPMEIEEAVEMILGVCSGVLACHRRGILHRDLKPANVFLHRSADLGTVAKVLDFGVAALAQVPSKDLTRPGQVVGTPCYYSPEQVKHLDVDEKSDQYCIALVLYAALSGSSPFAGKEGPDLARAILRCEYAHLHEARPGTPEWIEDVFLKAASVDKDQRYDSVLDMAREIIASAAAAGFTIQTDAFTDIEEPPPSSASGEAPALPADSGTKSRTKLGVPPAPESAEGRASLTTKRGIARARDASGDGFAAVPQDRRNAGNGVAVVLAPFEEVPTVDTTARLQTETAIDVSFSGAKFGPHGVPIGKDPALSPQPDARERSDQEAARPTPLPARADADEILSQGRRKNLLALAIILIAAILAGGITWAVARGGSRTPAERNGSAAE